MTSSTLLVKGGGELRKRMHIQLASKERYDPAAAFFPLAEPPVSSLPLRRLQQNGGFGSASRCADQESSTSRTTQPVVSGLGGAANDGTRQCLRWRRCWRRNRCPIEVDAPKDKETCLKVGSPPKEQKKTCSEIVVFLSAARFLSHGCSNLYG
jgi:hypothetical protein